MRLAIPFGEIERAVAKTALNFICAVVGPEEARRSELDGLRKFALEPYDARNAGYVSTFVREPAESLVRFCEPFCEAGHHTLVLAPLGRGEHLVLVILYQRPFAVVRLSRTKGVFPLGDEEKFGAVLFDYRAGTHRVFTFPDDFDWIAERLERVRK